MYQENLPAGKCARTKFLLPQIWWEQRWRCSVVLSILPSHRPGSSHHLLVGHVLLKWIAQHPSFISFIQLFNWSFPMVFPCFPHGFPMWFSLEVIASFEDFNNIYIVLEPVESVELVHVLQQWHWSNQGLSVGWLAEIARQLLEAFRHCHEMRSLVLKIGW